MRDVAVDRFEFAIFYGSSGGEILDGRIEMLWIFYVIQEFIPIGTHSDFCFPVAPNEVD